MGGHQDDYRVGKLVVGGKVNGKGSLLQLGEVKVQEGDLPSLPVPTRQV